MGILSVLKYPRADALVNVVRGKVKQTWKSVVEQYFDAVFPFFYWVRTMTFGLLVASAIGAVIIAFLDKDFGLGGGVAIAIFGTLAALFVRRTGQPGAMYNGTVAIDPADTYAVVKFPSISGSPLIRVRPVDKALEGKIRTSRVTDKEFTIGIDAVPAGASPPPVERVLEWTVRERPETMVIGKIVAASLWTLTLMSLLYLVVGMQSRSLVVILAGLPYVTVACVILFKLWGLLTAMSGKMGDALEIGPNAASAVLRSVLAWDFAPLEKFLATHQTSEKQDFSLVDQEGWENDRRMALAMTLAVIVTTYNAAALTLSWGIFGALKIAELWGWGVLALYDYRIRYFKKQATDEKAPTGPEASGAIRLRNQAVLFRLGSFAGYILITSVLLVLTIVKIAMPGTRVKFDQFGVDLERAVVEHFGWMIGAFACVVVIQAAGLLNIWARRFVRVVAVLGLLGCLGGLVWEMTGDRVANAAAQVMSPFVPWARVEGREVHLTFPSLPGAVKYRIKRRRDQPDSDKDGGSGERQEGYCTLSRNSQGAVVCVPDDMPKIAGGPLPIELDGGARSYVDGPLLPGARLRYRLIGVDKNGKETPSSETDTVVVMPDPEEPTKPVGDAGTDADTATDAGKKPTLKGATNPDPAPTVERRPAVDELCQEFGTCAD